MQKYVPRRVLSAIQQLTSYVAFELAHTTLVDTACRRQKDESAVQRPTGSNRAD